VTTGSACTPASGLCGRRTDCSIFGALAGDYQQVFVADLGGRTSLRTGRDVNELPLERRRWVGLVGEAVDRALPAPAGAPSSGPGGGVTRPEFSSGVLDLRTYKLVAQSGEEFDRIFRERALPMLQRHGIEVVGFGPSLEDADLYYLMRAFRSAALRDEQLDAFYGSDEWRDNHRDAVLSLVESYHTVVIAFTPSTAEGIEALRAHLPASG
jgi:hypothetical protein